MKQFKYKAKKSPVETIEGMISAATREEAVSGISELGLVPVDVREISTGASAPAKKTAAAPDVTASPKIPARELIALYRQWGRLLRSGVPILKALGILMEQSKRPETSAVLQTIHEDVKQGKNVSEAVRRYPRLFTAFDTALIEAGESVGKLYETLLELARYRENQLALTGKIRSALAYPLFVFLVGLGTVYFMLAKVIPQFALFFQDLGQTLPMPTRLLMSFSAFAQAYGLMGIAVAALLFFLIRSSLKIEKNRTAFDRLLLRLPLVGRLLTMAEIARITRTMELLLANGLSLLKSLRAAAPVCGNELFRVLLGDCAKAVEEGGVLSDVLRQSRLFPDMAVYLIRTGEEAGSLHEAMSEIAEWYEQEVQDALQVLTKLIESVLILFVGLVLGAIVMALLLPVFSMSAAVN